MIHPSYFADRGAPSCSVWGKSEIEWIALAYVQALANGGDTWRRLTREETYELLNDEQRRHIYNLLTSNTDIYKDWFGIVREQLTDAESAFEVGGWWHKRPNESGATHGE